MVGAMKVLNDLFWSDCMLALLADNNRHLMWSGKQLVFHVHMDVNARYSWAISWDTMTVRW